MPRPREARAYGVPMTAHGWGHALRGRGATHAELGCEPLPWREHERSGMPAVSQAVDRGVCMFMQTPY